MRSFESISGIGPASSLTLIAYNGGCFTNAPNAFTVYAPFISTTLTPTICPSYQISLYEVDVDLPPGQWQFGQLNDSRIAGIANINNSSSQGYYVGAFLDNTVSTQDNSPRFESVLRPITSAAALAPYSYSAFDTDGDSLRLRAEYPKHLLPAFWDEC